MSLYSKLYQKDDLFSKQRIDEMDLYPEFQTYLEQIQEQESPNPYVTEEILYDVILRLNKFTKRVENEALKNNFHEIFDVEYLLQITEIIFHLIVHNPYDVIEERDFFKFLNLSNFLFVLVEKKDKQLMLKLIQFYNLFNHKLNDEEYTQTYSVDVWINLIRQMDDLFKLFKMNDKEYCDNFILLVDFIIEVRRYYASDENFIAEIESFFSKIKREGLVKTSTLTPEITERLEEVAKINGVYNYSVLDFYQLKEYAQRLHDIKGDLEILNKNMVETERILQGLKSEKKSLDASNNDMIKQFSILKQRTYEDFISQIQQDSQLEIKKNFDKFQEKVDEQTNELQTEWEIFNQALSMVAEEMMNASIFNLEDTQPSGKKSQNVKATASMIRPKTLTSKKYTSISYFDPKKSLKKRLKELNKHKVNNQLYHKCFDQVAKSVLNNDVVYLVGESGTGKTFLAYQIADILGLPLYNLGFVVDEFLSIKGARDANGNFIETPFYIAYKYGGICFFDEIDNSESKALIELNKVIGTNGYQPYIFGNGETVTPHPNFRIIAAGNTWGDGATLANNTREKLDEATINRFTSIYVDYDQDLEKKIMKKYPAYFNALLTLREYYQEASLPYVITTRDMCEFAQKLDTDCFDLEELIATKLVRNKRKDTIETITRYLENCDVSSDFVKALKKCKKR